MTITGSGHDRALAHAAASDPAVARPRGERPEVVGPACHLPVQPLDSPLQGFALHCLLLDALPQGFDLPGEPPLFPLVLRGQPPRNLRDDQFGTVDYRRSVEILRGDTDQWIRRSDQEIAASGWPSLAVSKAEFGDEWPFRDDRVTVECRDGLFCIVNIGGYDFALNGAARSRFGLPFAHDAGVAVLGKSVGPFIEMAHGLSA